MSAVKPPASTPRVDKLRADRDSAGLKRRELYASDAEFEQIKAQLVDIRKKAASLARSRKRKEK